MVFSNRDKRTLMDKMVELFQELELAEPFILLADAYYATRKIGRALVDSGNHLVTRVRSNSVAYYL